MVINHFCCCFHIDLVLNAFPMLVADESEMRMWDIVGPLLGGYTRLEECCVVELGYVDRAKWSYLI